MQFVHVSCLNSWRAAAVSDSSYFRCDACHYEYRLERIRYAEVIVSGRFQHILTALILVMGACVFGAAGCTLFPDALPRAIDTLALPPDVRGFFLPTKDNPKCWTDGYSYELCCLGRPGGNPKCWDAVHTFASCCAAPSAGWQRAQVLAQPAARLLATGLIALSSVGFAMFVWRQLHENWGDVNGRWHLVMMIMSLGSMHKSALTRACAFIGVGVACRELLAVVSARAKLFAATIGDRVLEVS